MLSEWIPGLVSLTPELVWGLFSRGIGLVLAISFLSLMPQVMMMSGSQGGIPVAMRLGKIRKDFAAPKRFLYFPTLLWVSSSDFMLRLLTVVGFASACVVMYGGPLGPWAIALCYVCYLSLDMPMGLIFPWDCMLFEIVVLGMFLPETHALPELAATATPAPALTWAYRLLLFRVMFGFGKNKFMGASKEDNGYLKGFLSAQPLPNILGWYAQKMPMWVMHLLMLFMFITEIPVPFFFLIPGDLSIVAAAFTGLLMVGIITFGSFGYFSIATIAACLPLFDNTTPTQLDVSTMFGASAPNGTNAFVLAHTIGALFVFPFNSWVAQSWSHWTVFLRLKPRFLSWPITVLRALHPFRWLHPYGVFPPKTFPSTKGSVVVEVSWDGDTWHECAFRFFACNEKSKPRFVAPHHPRGDQSVIYEAFGLSPVTMIASLAGPFDPYGFGKKTAAALLGQHILQGNGARYIGSAELVARKEPPKWARVTTALLEPASHQERVKEGRYWRRTIVGPHAPPQQLDPDFWRYLSPAPEMWHPDACIWRRRSRLGELMRGSERGGDVHRLAVTNSDVLSSTDLTTFWDEFVPLISDDERADWNTLPMTVARFRERFDRATQHKMELLMGRYSALLEARLQPLYLHRGLRPAEMPAKTYVHLWMLTQHVIAQGRKTYDAVCADPRSAAGHLETMTLENGLYFLCIFRFESMTFDAQKLRLIKAVMGPYTDEVELQPRQQRMVDVMQRLFGYFEIAALVATHFKGSEYDKGYPERYPKFGPQNGEVKPLSWPRHTARDSQPPSQQPPAA